METQQFNVLECPTPASVASLGPKDSGEDPGTSAAATPTAAALRNQYQRVPEGSETMDLSDLNAPNDATTALPGPAPTEPAEEEAPCTCVCIVLYSLHAWHGIHSQ